MDFIKNIKIAKEENSTLKIEGEIPFEVLETHHSKAVKHIGKDLEMDGFRKGHVPEAKIIERVGEMAVLSEMAEHALAEVYPKILKEHKIDAIGHPQISITKIAKDNPLGFTALVAILPEITLPDYKKIASKENKNKESDEVTNIDVEKQIEEVLRQKIAYERIQSKAENETKVESQKSKARAQTKGEQPAPSNAAGKNDNTIDLPTPETVEKPESSTLSDESESVEVELPELTDEYVKTLGQPGQFETVEDFKTKIREHLEVEKKQEAVAKHRAKITDAIIEKAEIELPQVLIDSEINQMFAQMNEDLKRANLKMDDYLSHIKKSKEDLAKEWMPSAEKRAKLQLVLNEIAKSEEVTPDKALLDQQVDQLKEQYKDADEARVRIYVSSVMTNEAVMKLLENS